MSEGDNRPHLGMRIGCPPMTEDLIREDDLDGQRLFAIILHKLLEGRPPMCRIETGGGDWLHSNFVPPYVLSQWARQPLSFEDLRTALDAPSPPPSWPPALYNKAATWDTVRQGPFRAALREGLDQARYFNVSSPGQLLKVLAAVAQAFLEKDPAKNEHLRVARVLYQDALQQQARAKEVERSKQEHVRQHYEFVSGLPTVEQSTPFAPSQSASSRSRPEITAQPKRPAVKRPEPWPPFTNRMDEASGFLRMADMFTVSWASHIGPRFAHKEENQDAVNVLIDEKRIYFALADGVSTSFGSRFAAAAVAHNHCELAKRSADSGLSPSAALVAAGAETHALLDQILHYLTENPGAQEWREVKGDSRLEREVISRLMENTRVPQNRFWGPVLATTLIAGVLDQELQNSTLTVVRIGDGLVEKALNTGEVATLLGMDSSETEISESMSPGPLSKEAIASAVPVTVQIAHGEGLLVSSDGLARGLDAGVLPFLRKITNDPTLCQYQEASRSAMQVLRQACAYADETFSRDEKEQLFGDNLSLILLSPIRRH